MTDRRQEALTKLANMLDAETIASMLGHDHDDQIGSEIGELAFDNVYASLWSRSGLSLRDRSFVTLGILITLRADQELATHFKMALRNGITEGELSEVIYHASGYAGFPAAARARGVAAAMITNNSKA